MTAWFQGWFLSVAGKELWKGNCSYTKHSRNLLRPVTLHSEVHSGLATQSWPSSGNSAVPLREEAELAMIGCAYMETHEEISQLKKIGNLNASNDVTAERNLMANKKNNKNVLLFLFKNTNIKNKIYIWNTLFCFVFLFRTLFYASQEVWTYSVTRGKYGGIYLWQTSILSNWNKIIAVMNACFMPKPNGNKLVLRLVITQRGVTQRGITQMKQVRVT